MMRRIVLVLLAVVPVLAQDGGSTFWKRERHLQFGPPFAWPQTLAPTAPGTEITHEQVFRLVKELFDNETPPVYDIEQFRVAPLERGKIHMVVVVDETGRGFFNGLVAIHCSGSSCSCDFTDSDWPNDLAEQIVDPEGEGVFKVVTKHWVLGYEGARTKPIFTYSIERIKTGTKLKAFDEVITGPDFFDVTPDYAEYYTAKLLPKIEQARKGVEEKYGREEDRAEARAAAEFAYDDYRRRILHDPKAGFENAISWLESPYREVQTLGISSLEAIYDKPAEEKLQELTRSKDKDKAGEAERALKRRAERKSGLGR